jgi:transposase InsO family protein
MAIERAGTRSPASLQSRSDAAQNWLREPAAPSRCAAAIQPSRPSARICCLFSSPKTLPVFSRASVAGFGCPPRIRKRCRFSAVHQWPVLGVHRGSATTDSNHVEPVAPNLLQRDFTAAAPDRVWVADTTYKPALAGFIDRPRGNTGARRTATHHASLSLSQPSGNELRDTCRGVSNFALSHAQRVRDAFGPQTRSNHKRDLHLKRREQAEKLVESGSRLICVSDRACSYLDQ